MKQRIIFAALLLDFVAFSAWAAHSMGWSLGAMYADLAASPIFMQVGVDLVVALGFVVAWMWRDAKRRGMNPLPFAIGTLFTGSIAPLLYMVVRRPLEEEAEAPAPSFA